MKRKLLCLCLIFGILLSLSMTVGAKSFDDTEEHWAEEAIDKWSGNGILNGVGNNNFNPNGLMTRAEAAAVFSRLLALSERANISDFKDVDSDAWYAESLEKCVAAGILNGDGSNMNPNGYITREMFFTMFCRTLSIQPETTLTKEFSDSAEISSWAQGYTYAFINQGYVNGVTKDTVAPKQNIDRASVITLLDRLIANYAVQDNDVLQSTDKGISLVIANNCTVADGFSGTVVISGDDTKISFKGASVNTKIIVKADNAVIADVPEGVTISVVNGSENVEVNGKQVEEDTTFTATVEKVEEKEDKKPVIVGGGGHSHRYTGSETTKATCTEDGVMTYTCRCGRSYTETIPRLSENDEHTPAEPVKENETETTYDEVVYCSVCTVEISRTQKSNVSCIEHTPATAVKENEVAGTCKVEGTYDEVVYCSVCDSEISRTQKTGGYGEHVPAEAIKENEVTGTCKVEGTYDEVIYCSVCNTHEISRTQKTSGYGEHTPATAIKENEVVGNCQTHATYDEVVYCSVCGTHEISRIQKTGELGDHTPGTPVRENEVTGTCVVEGTYDEVVYCSVCGTHEISRTQKTSGYGEHIPATAVKENEVVGTCVVEGTYDEVVYCSVCNTYEISRTQKTSGYGEHVSGTSVRENEVAGTCLVEGTYDEVIYCSVCNTYEISRTQKTSGYGEHIPAQAVRENEVAGSCVVEGTYDEVIYCSVCGTYEISRTQKSSGYGEHVAGTSVKENEVAGTCQTPATYDEVVYCSVCETHEISRTQKTGELGNHTPGTPVKENKVAGTCKVEDTYDEVVYCSVCNTHEISRTQKTSGYGEHTPATAIRENEVDGNCQTPATYDEVIYCSVCGTHEISRTQKTGALGNHTPGTPVRENEVAGDCQTPATYDEVIYCSVCGTHEISRTQKTGELGNHTPGTPVKENEVAGDCQTPATYDEVIYCSVCGTHEISRTQKTGELGDHNFVSGSCEYCGEPDPNYNPESPDPSEGLEYDSNGDSTCYLVGIGDCTDTDIVIPEISPDGDTVFAIDRNAFADEPITSITIPTTIEEIGRNAFNGCNSLTDVYYLGTETEWEALCEEIGTGNNALLNANIHFAEETVTYDGPTIVVESVTVGAGDTVEVAISVVNNPGVSSLKVFVEYDEKLVLENVSFTSLFGSLITAPTPYTNPQTISMMSPLADIAEDGEFAILTFDVSALESGEKADITLTYDQGNTFDIDFGNVVFSVANGSVSK